MLTNLLSSPRFARMVEQEAVDGAAAYTPADFLATVRKGLWKELDAPQVKIDAYRRNLQHAYLDLANNKINGAAPVIPAGLPAELLAMLPAAASADEKSLYRAELRSLNASIAAALAKTTDRQSKAHLEGARDQIARILDPKFAQPTSAATSVIRLGIDDPEICWPDYIIRP